MARRLLDEERASKTAAVAIAARRTPTTAQSQGVEPEEPPEVLGAVVGGAVVGGAVVGVVRGSVVGSELVVVLGSEVVVVDSDVLVEGASVEDVSAVVEVVTTLGRVTDGCDPEPPPPPQPAATASDPSTTPSNKFTQPDRLDPGCGNPQRTPMR